MAWPDSLQSRNQAVLGRLREACAIQTQQHTNLLAMPGSKVNAGRGGQRKVHHQTDGFGPGAFCLYVRSDGTADSRGSGDGRGESLTAKV